MSGYWNDISQKEVREVLANDRDCFRTRAEADANLEASGRFRKQNETQIVGAALPTYPALPSGPWSEPDPGLPDPATDQYGDINAQEPVGSEAEIQKSLERLTQSERQSILPGADRVSQEPISEAHTEVGSAHAPTAPLNLRDGEVVAGGGFANRPNDNAAPSHPSPKPFARRF
jgi:hypothetical protein